MNGKLVGYGSGSSQGSSPGLGEDSERGLMGVAVMCFERCGDRP